MKPHWEALTPDTRTTFHACAKLPFIRDFYFELDAHPLIELTNNVEGVRLASIREIGAMKLAADAGRKKLAKYLE